MSENENKKGFAGLSSLESSVEPIVSQPPPEAKPEIKPESTSAPDAPSAPPPISTVVPKYTYSPEMDFVKKYWLWIAIGIVVIYALSSGGDKSTGSSGTSSYSSNYTPSLSESMPSYGSGAGHVLTASEIYYCLAEGVRIEQNRGSINQYDSLSIDRFNRTIEDFNGRCSDYRYKQSAMTSATKALDSNRYLIEAQGRARM